MRKKKPPTKRINGTMDTVLYGRMEEMMKADRIFGEKEFLEKLVREEWQRRLSSTSSLAADKAVPSVAQAMAASAPWPEPDAEPPPPPPPTAVRATRAVPPKGRKGRATG